MNLPPGEAHRLRTLQLFDVMDTAAEASFDNLAALAAQICDAPISLVSLVDESRQWFKARVGLEAPQTPRDQAFCAHAIESESVMVVEDAAEDPRFAQNPLVTGDPFIRFYAGAPLTVGDGLRLGTLCVIDRRPRTLAPHQRAALETLRDSVVALLQLRRARAQTEQLRKLLPVCAWCSSVRVDEEGDSRWVSLTEYVSRQRQVTHGVCDACEAAIEASL